MKFLIMATSPHHAVAITETSNELTSGLSDSTAEQIVRLLRQADAQIFSGWRELPSLTDESTLDTIASIARAAASILSQSPQLSSQSNELAANLSSFSRTSSTNKFASSPSTCIYSSALASSVYATSRIVITGSGTSGRMAFVISRAFNEIMIRVGKAPCFEYLHAGEDPALFLSREAPEDNWQLAERRLAEIMSRSSKVMLVGITCGISAPFVASQIDFAMKHLDDKVHAIALIGFNLCEQARNTPVEGWSKTVADVVRDMLHQKAQGAPCFILNPIVGPEAVTGSTRMKGGSATKILLEVIFERAFVIMVRASSTLNNASLMSSPILQRRTQEASSNWSVDNTSTYSLESSPSRVQVMRKDSTGSQVLNDSVTCDDDNNYTTHPVGRDQCQDGCDQQVSTVSDSLNTEREPARAGGSTPHNFFSSFFRWLRRYHDQEHHHSDCGEIDSEIFLSHTRIRHLLMNYEAAMRTFYLCLNDVGTAIELVAKSLQNKGHIYYLGRNTYGLAAVIDASECQPTYNARFEDVRAFLCGGYQTLRNVQGDLTAHHKHFRLSWRNFLEDIVPILSDVDTIVVVDGCYTSPDTKAAMEDEALLPEILHQCKTRSASIMAVVIGKIEDKAISHHAYNQQGIANLSNSISMSPVDELLASELEQNDLFDFTLHIPLQLTTLDTVPLPVYAEFGMKLALNALSTGAFVMAGKVMTNRMIDLQVCKIVIPILIVNL